MIWLLIISCFAGAVQHSNCQVRVVNRCVQGASRQSPINLDPGRATREVLPPLRFNRFFYFGDTVSLINTGSTVEVTFPAGTRPPRLTGGPLLNEVFEMNNMHFHWGPYRGKNAANDIGSEHTLSGRRFGIEAHLVFFNLKYGTFDNAAAQPDGLSVIGIFGETGRGDNPLLNGLVSKVPTVTYPDATTPLSARDAFGWLEVLWQRPEFYFTYHGSLTTPNFSENVRWIVFPTTEVFSTRQIQPFRNTLKSDLTRNEENFRELQPRCGRKIILTSTGR